MNDRYLFRGRVCDADHGLYNESEWVQGALVWDKTGTYIIHKLRLHYCANSICVEVDPATVGQCTGLKDKNGRLIFEGDVVETPRNLNINQKKTCIGIVSYQKAAWYVCPPGESPLYMGDAAVLGCKIIGNVHDSPELLEGKTS